MNQHIGLSTEGLNSQNLRPLGECLPTNTLLETGA